MPTPRLLIHYAVGFVLILVHLMIGNALASWTNLPVPGSVVGMLLLVLSLHLGLVRIRYVRRTSGFLLRYMALFFVPPGVGVMLYFDLISYEWPALVVASVLSTVAVLLVVGLAEQRLAEGE